VSLVAYGASYSKPEWKCYGTMGLEGYTYPMYVCEVSILRKVKLGSLASGTVGLHAEFIS
ncbi:hypothetical protein Tco_1389735, partial [Tanacetum coccineum]